MPKQCAWGDAALGAACGLAATWAMTLAGKLFMKAGSKAVHAREKQAIERDPEPATVKAARALAGPFGVSIGGREELAGNAVHYATGAGFGGLFALVMRGRAWPWWAAGLGFGAAVWLGNDEGLAPLLGFARGPRAYPGSIHAKALASHLVYGLSLAGAREGLRAL